MNLRDNETFQNVFLFCVFLGVGASLLTRHIFKKRDIDVYSKRSNIIVLTIGLAPVIILLWLMPDLSLKGKIVISFLGVLTEFSYYCALDKSGKRIRKSLGIKNKEDQWEEEQAKLKGKDKESM